MRIGRTRANHCYIGDYSTLWRTGRDRRIYNNFFAAVGGNRHIIDDHNASAISPRRRWLAVVNTARRLADNIKAVYVLRHIVGERHVVGVEAAVVDEVNGETESVTGVELTTIEIDDAFYRRRKIRILNIDADRVCVIEQVVVKIDAADCGFRRDAAGGTA